MMKKLMMFLTLTIVALPAHADLTDEDDSAAQNFVADMPENMFIQVPAQVLRNLRRGRLALSALGIDNSQKAALDNFLTGVSNLKFITHVDLVALGLDELPPAILSLKNLTHLNLARNNLRTLPEAIKNLNKLQTIGLQQNPIQTFTDIVTGDDGRQTKLLGYADITNHFRDIKLTIDIPDDDEDAPSGAVSAAAAASAGGGGSAAAAAAAPAETVSAAEHQRVQEELTIHTQAYYNVTRRLAAANDEVARLKAENADLRRQLAAK